MNKLTNSTFIKTIGESVVDFADGQLGTATKLVEGDHRIVRLNLIAFFVFALTWAAAGWLEEDDLCIFQDRLAREAARRSGAKHTDRMIRLIHSRYKGFVSSIVKYQSEEFGLPNYFQACCSANRVKIGYEEMYPHPDDLVRMAKSMKEFSGCPTDDWRSLVEKSRNASKPAVYRLNYIISVKLLAFLTAAMESYKDLVDGYCH